MLDRAAVTSNVDVTIVGSGFAGSILASALARQGLQVRLVEKGRHPRTALGESSTPLAALSAERLARDYDLDAVASLGSWGPWQRHHPNLVCGLKRGFTFYRHHPGQAPRANERMLVAASPFDEVADVHWLREDVDHFLFEYAGRCGAQTVENLTLTQALEGVDGMEVSGHSTTHPESQVSWRTRFLIDGSGPGGLCAGSFGIDRFAAKSLDTALIWGHFEGVALPASPSSEQATDGSYPVGPYPENLAAVHHLLDTGWIYSLRFDNGLTSAGFVVDRPHAPRSQQEAQALWTSTIEAHPALRSMFRSARPRAPLGLLPKLQHRLETSSGPRWALLPHSYAFFGPMFSTGIAWSLLAVERLARILPVALRTSQETPFDRYSHLLAREAEQVERLLTAAHLARQSYPLFRLVAELYFVLVSYAEAKQRLFPERLSEPASWNGLLGAGDPKQETLLIDLVKALRSGESPIQLTSRLTTDLAPYDLIGQDLERPFDHYPVDLELLLERADKLGASRSELYAALPKLGLTPDQLPAR